MHERGWIAHLESWAQSELGLQRRLAEVLAEQETALVQGDVPTLERLGAEIEALIASEPARAARRQEILGALASAWGVSAGALSLGGVAHRAGASGARLLRLREELAEAVRAVGRRVRKLAILARSQQAMLQELIAAALGRSSAELGERGALVDAEA